MRRKTAAFCIPPSRCLRTPHASASDAGRASGCSTLESSAPANAGLTLPPYTTRLCTPSQRRPTPPGPRLTRAFRVPRPPTTRTCGSASATARPRTESPSRTEEGAGPSCLLLLNVVMFFGARTAASCTRSIIQPRSSGRVYREIRDQNPSQTLALSLGIPRSTPGRRRGSSGKSTLARLGQATCQT